LCSTAPDPETGRPNLQANLLLREYLLEDQALVSDMADFANENTTESADADSNDVGNEEVLQQQKPLPMEENTDENKVDTLLEQNGTDPAEAKLQNQTTGAKESSDGLTVKDDAPTPNKGIIHISDGSSDIPDGKDNQAGDDSNNSTDVNIDKDQTLVNGTKTDDGNDSEIVVGANQEDIVEAITDTNTNTNEHEKDNNATIVNDDGTDLDANHHIGQNKTDDENVSTIIGKVVEDGANTNQMTGGTIEKEVGEENLETETTQNWQIKMKLT
jgi:hypothetical protein